jgi:hypothetical protein
MKRYGAPMTREAYLNWAFMGEPPAILSAEEEAELPPQFQLRQIALDKLEEILTCRIDELKGRSELSAAEEAELFDLETEVKALLEGVFPCDYE